MSRRALLLFAGLGVVWGIPYLLIKVALDELEPATLVLARTGLAALVVLPVALGQRSVGPALRRWAPVLAYSVIEIVVPWFFLARAEQHLSSSLTGLLLAGVPVVGVGIALLTRRSENLGVTGGLGLLVGLVGVGLLVGFEGDVAGGGPQVAAMGELAITVVCYAVGPVILARYLADVPASGVIAVSLVMSTAVYAVPGALAAPDRMPSFTTVACVVVLAVVCTALAFAMFFALLGEVGPVRTTLITYLNPAVAVLAGALLLDERITWATLAGFTLVVGGSALASGRRVGAAGEPPEPGADLAAQQATMEA